ncbi:ribosomal protein S10 domain-containing protein [Phlebopus sp. FC_14]|nr:ribosomal protein S10 domain-containing protein [Phlebopus sp. FC_14]
MLPRPPRLSLPALSRWVRFNSGSVPTTEPTPPPVQTPPESDGMTPLTEPELASMVIRGRSLYPPTKLPRPHSIPVAEIHLRSHHHYYLDIFAHFIGHAASALGIPASGPVPLPTQRSLWTVLRGPFVHKKSQENFERRVHKRVIKAWDAHPEVVDMWVKYLVKHQMPGVGIRVTRWERAPLALSQKFSLGAKRNQSDSSAQQVKKMAEKIVAQELSRGGDSTVTVTTPRRKS